MTNAEKAALHGLCFTNPRPWSEAEFASLQADASTLCLETTQAFILIRTVAGEAEILTLAVHPDARRQGLGRSLLAQAEAGAVSRGAARMFLEVAADNAAAIGLYEQAGYARSGLRKRYYRFGDRAVDAFLMTRTL